MLTVTADIREARTGALDEPPAEHRHIQVTAETYEQAKGMIREKLPAGWVISSWRVDAEVAGPAS